MSDSSTTESTIIPIDLRTNENENFREVIHTTALSQLVLMSLLPGEDIGMEIHKKVDQLIKVEGGSGISILNGVRKNILEGDFVLINAGTEHNIVNSHPTQKLKLYTIYTPPNHPAGTIHRTKSEAERDEDDVVIPDADAALVSIGYDRVSFNTRCDWCKAERPSRKCGRCRKVRYCGQPCASQAWREHSKSCLLYDVRQ